MMKNFFIPSVEFDLLKASFRSLYSGLAFIAITQQVSAQTALNAGLKTPAGFQATVIAENLGRTRHLDITPQGNIYVRLGKLKDGKGTLYLTQHDGTATVTTAFGDFFGTGVKIKNGYLYTSSDSEVFRYKLNEKNEVINPDVPEKIVMSLISM